MSTVRAGVVTSVEVNGPAPAPSVKPFDLTAPGTWSLIWFVVAVLLLFII